ncbi:hypothetical protein CQA53_10595, partial [Helicobacter didelphidarum]
MGEDKLHSIMINNIHQGIDAKEVKNKINNFLNLKKNISIIAPNSYIIECLYDHFILDKNIEAKFYCHNNINFDELHNTEQINKRRNKIQDLNIEFINNNDKNPFSKFLINVKKTAKEQINKPVDDSFQIKMLDILLSLLNSPLSNPADLYHISDMEKRNILNENFDNFSFFEYIDLLDYSKAYISETTLDDIQKDAKDSSGIKVFKEFFLELANMLEKQFKIYIEDNKERQKQINQLQATLKDTRDKILINLQEAYRQKDDDKARMALLMFLKLAIGAIAIYVSFGGGAILAILSMGITGITTGFGFNNIIKEYNEIKDNRYYRAIVVPLLEVLFDNVAYAIALCNPKLQSLTLLDNESNFLDLSGIYLPQLFIDSSFILTPYTNHIIEGKYAGNVHNVIDLLRGDKKFDIDNFSNTSCMCVSALIDSNTNINKSVSYKFFTALQDSYKNLVYIQHPIFASSFLAKTIKYDDINYASQDYKHYILVTPPPKKHVAGSVEAITDIFQTQIQGRPTPPVAQKHNPTQDYSRYILKDKKNKNQKELFLQISPFVKATKNKKKYWRDLPNMSLADRDYIQSCMIQNSTLEQIKEMQKKAVKKVIQNYKQIFDNIKSPYTADSIFIKATILYCMEEEHIQIMQGFLGTYAEFDDIDEKLYGRNTRFEFYPNNDSYTQKIPIKVDLQYIKDQIKQAIVEFEKNEHNEFTILVGTINYAPFSKNLSHYSLSTCIDNIKQDLGKELLTTIQLDEALIPIVKAIGQNILTTILPSTKILFADSKEKKLEALSIIFTTLCFTSIYSVNKSIGFKDSLKYTSGLIQLTKIPYLIKQATFEVLEKNMQDMIETFKNNKNIMKTSNKNNKHIMDTLNQLQNRLKYLLESKKQIIANRYGIKLFAFLDSDTLRITIDYHDDKKYSGRNQISNEAKIRHSQTSKAIAKKILISDLSKNIGLGIAEVFIEQWIKHYYQTDSKELLERYKELELKLQPTYNAPLFMDNDTFLTYPIPIHSRMIVYNFAYGLFG